MKTFRKLRYLQMYFFYILFLNFHFLPVKAQDAEPFSSIRLGIGLTDFEGFNGSAEIAFPILKSFEISSSFLYSTTIPYSLKQVLLEHNIVTSINLKGNNDIFGHSAGFLSLLLLFKPLSLVHSEKLKAHQIGIGAGPCYNFYSLLNVKYSEFNNEIERFSLKTNNDISFCYLNFYYMYNVNRVFSVGLRGSVIDLDGEATLFTGISAGINIHK